MRIASIIAASVAGLFSLGLLAAGGLLLWGDSQKDEQGYLSTTTHRFATNTAGLATENLDLDLDGLDAVIDQDRYGKLRLKVDATNGKPVFVGIAPTREVTRYLNGTSHALVTDVSYSPFKADYRAHPAGPKPGTPAEQTFWAATAHGTGQQTLTWDVEDGQLVGRRDERGRLPQHRRADQRRRRAPFLSGIGWGVTIGGDRVLLGSPPASPSSECRTKPRAARPRLAAQRPRRRGGRRPATRRSRS